jgi:hypothetical protein
MASNEIVKDKLLDALGAHPDNQDIQEAVDAIEKAPNFSKKNVPEFIYLLWDEAPETKDNEKLRDLENETKSPDLGRNT